MKSTIKGNVLYILAISAIFSFQSCKKETISEKTNTKILQPTSFRVTFNENGYTKTAIELSSFTSNETKAQSEASSKRGKSDFKASGTLIANGFPTSQFLIDFNAVNNKSGSKGSIVWTGSLFDSTTLKVHYLNIEGNAAVVGGIVMADGWAFPKGYYICLLLRDNGDGITGTPDQMNNNLFSSATDDGTSLTPSSSFWNQGWYTLNSQLSIK